MRNVYFASLVGLAILVMVMVYVKPTLLFGTKDASPSVQLTSTPERTLLVGTQWVWLHTEIPNDGMLATPERESYVLTFDAIGHVQSTTDCNTIIGRYELNAGALLLGPLSSTKKACPESLDATYAKELGLVNSYDIVGNRLYLNLNRDTGRMVFEVK